MLHVLRLLQFDGDFDGGNPTEFIDVMKRPRWAQRGAAGIGAQLQGIVQTKSHTLPRSDEIAGAGAGGATASRDASGAASGGPIQTIVDERFVGPRKAVKHEYEKLEHWQVEAIWRR
jgi:hypothetical protein